MGSMCFKTDDYEESLFNTLMDKGYKTVAETASRLLGSKADSVLLVTTKGIIQYANPAACETFGWSVDKLVGNNITLLMPRTFARQHDQLMQRYEEKLRNEEQTSQAAVSGVVGLGRDVVAVHRDGTQLQQFLTIYRLDMSSDAAKDTLLLGMFREALWDSSGEHSTGSVQNKLGVGLKTHNTGHDSSHGKSSAPHESRRRRPGTQSDKAVGSPRSDCGFTAENFGGMWSCMGGGGVA